LRFPATVRPSFQFAPVTCRSASPSDLPATCAACRSSGSAFQLNLRLSSAARFFGQLSNQSPACAFNRSFSPAFQPIFNLRLRLTFRLRLPIDLRPSPLVDLPACLPTHLQLAPSVNLPAQLSRSRPACAFCQRFSSAFKPNLRLSSAAVFAWRCPLVYMRPSPLITLPALPANATADSHRSLYPYGDLLAALRLAPPINHPACLRIQPSTTRLLCPFGAAFRLICDSRRTINLPAQPVDPISDSSTAVFSGGAFQLIFRLASPINLPACLLFHLRLSSPIACLAPPSKPTSDLPVSGLIPVTVSNCLDGRPFRTRFRCAYA